MLKLPEHHPEPGTAGRGGGRHDRKIQEPGRRDTAGDEQLDGGAGVEYDAELLAEITSAIAAIHGPRVMDPDVLPPATTSLPAVDVFSSRGAPAQE